MSNPLLEKFDQPFGTIPFNEIKTDDFVSALDAAIEEAKSEIDAIANNPEDPTFDNTILAQELSGKKLGRVATTYFHLFGSESDQDFQNLAGEISPKLAKFGNDINLNKDLFKRVEEVYINQFNTLNDEDARLTELSYKGFVRNGAKLSDEDKDKIRSLDEEMSTLSPQFSNNSLNATNSYELWLNENDLDGLPQMIKDGAKMAAKSKGREDDWLFTLQFPSYYPFMKFSNRRDLRQELMTASVTKCNGGEFDNTEICKRIAKLKHERAMLLGYDNFADYVLEKRMAENQTNIYNLLDNLYEACFEPAKEDLRQIKEIAKEIDDLDDIKPWDTVYYAEKLKQKLYDFNEDSLRPYFKSENVVNGVFEIAKRMYGLDFVKLDNIQTWHEDVNVYEVKDEDGSHVGILYEDLFPRETKRSGAWMNELRSQGMQGGEVKRPHVTFSCNLTKPTDTSPSLLTFAEVTTIFHEFGHCLHGLLSNRKYTSVGGTSVFWDFVELPSQIMENWVGEKEALSLFAHHYETGEVIPDELLDKIKDSKNFMSGTMCLRQLSLGYLDMAWFGKDNNVENVEEFEWNAVKKTALMDKMPGSSISCSLGHIFAGGYSAGYYSYKWAEVLEADAFEKFKEDGLFNRETAQSFRDNILSQGNMKHPMELYKSFRGREPKVEALLKRDGLMAENEA
tara:strand:+ start:16384 stop:18420 length:2037 start_codon:yes stop_codon:yes gene_type:complete